MIEKIYQKKVLVKAFQFDGDADNFIFNPNTPQWAINAIKNEEIKKHNSETLYIDHREHTDFVHKGDYIINENGRIFSLEKERFDKLYEHKDGWIPCSERLPENKEYDWVPAQIREDNGYMWIPKVMEYRETINDWFCEEIGWLSEHNGAFSVIAWQPLPEAYHEPLD